MLAYRDGDAAAFEVLYARHRGRLFRYLLHQCARREQADEMFQEVWMSVIRARGNYEVSAKFTTWLFRIAHNRLIDGYRARGRLAEFEADATDFEGDPPDHPAPTSGQPEQLYERALDLVEKEERISTSWLQRRLRVSYNRAAELMARMEEDGYVGYDEGAGRGREVLLVAGGDGDEDDWLE